MDLKEILQKTGGLAAMAKELGMNEAQAASGAAALLPALLGGFKKQATKSPTGLEGLGGLLGQLGGGGLLEDVLAPRPTNVSLGNNVLGQIFGSKDVSRAVAQRASSQTGLDPTVLKRMLPMLAMLVAGVMAKQAAPARAQTAAGGGGLGGLLGGLLGEAGRGGKATGTPTSGLAAMLDMDGDGNPLDDILRMVGKVAR